MDNIPLDCLSTIFSFIGVEDIPNLLFLCKRFTNVLQRDSLWKTIFHRNINKKHIIHPELMTDGQWKRATLKNYPKLFRINLKSETDMFSIGLPSVKGTEDEQAGYVALPNPSSRKFRYIPVLEHLHKENTYQNCLYCCCSGGVRLVGGWKEDTVSLVSYPFHHRLEMMEGPRGVKPYTERGYSHFGEILHLGTRKTPIPKVDLSPIFRYLE